MISVIIVTGKVFCCFCLYLSLEQYKCETLFYNQKQNKVLYVNMENMDFLPPSAPNLVFDRETYMAYFSRTQWYSQW